MNRLKFPKILLGLSALGFLLILISTADGSGVICDFLAHPSIVSKCDPVLIEDQESSMLSHNNRNKELQCSQRYPTAHLTILKPQNLLLTVVNYMEFVSQRILSL